tara:strand:+ start:307 stop:576 length:270 start_codon:yes stop_codon:yes gene_type:complete
MAEIINLRMARKAKARATAQASADINRTKYGRTMAERQAVEREEETRARLLDGARREREDGVVAAARTMLAGFGACLPFGTATGSVLLR